VSRNQWTDWLPPSVAAKSCVYSADFCEAVQVPIHWGQVCRGHEALGSAEKSPAVARFGHQRNERPDQPVAHEARNGVVAGSYPGAPVALVAGQHFVATVSVERHRHVLPRQLGDIVRRDGGRIAIWLAVVPNQGGQDV